MSEKEKKTQEPSPMAWILAHAGEGKGAYIASVLFAVMGVLCQIIPYVCASRIIVKLMEGSRDMGEYLSLFFRMAAGWVLRVFLHSVSTTLSHRATFKALANIRRLCMDKLVRLPLGAVQERPSGTWKNIIMERIDSLETTLAHIIPEFTSNLLGSLVLFVMVWMIDWRMALFSLLSLPLGLLFFMGMFIGYEENYKKTVEATSDLNNVSVEYIYGIEVIKVFGRLKGAYERFAKAARVNAESYIGWMRSSNFYFCFAYNIMPATMLAVLPAGCFFVMKGSLTPAELVNIIILSVAMIIPITTCLTYTDDMAVLGTVTSQIREILEAKEMERPAKGEDNASGDMTIKLEDVHFSYKDTEVLHGINMTIKDGSFVALAGPSGSGKSTIARLIASLWDVDEGKVTIGGRDIRAIPQEEYADMIAYVSQDNYLFNETVRENIRLGDPGASDEEVINAAKACGCHDFITELENGYDTVCGSGGGHLSGGEKQRICIARAMLKNAPVVILDEATAYTDPESEAEIQKAVATLIKGKTLIVIAHRLSTIKNADTIFVVKDGMIEEEGTHESLMAKGGLYKTMYDAHMAVKDSDTERRIAE